MALYEKSVRLLMHDLASSLEIQAGQIIERRQVQAWFANRYPKVKEGTINAHLNLMSINAPSRIHHHPKQSGEDDLFFQLDASHFRLYDPQTDPTPIYRETPPYRGREDDDPDSSDTFEAPPPASTPGQAAEFAYERDLRNFLAKNLTLIEPNLRLYEEEGITGVEFPAGGRFVDILALDSNNDYVVIELKVSKGYDRVVGQLLRYMAWIESHHADTGQQVRGVIVAREISEDLILACSRVVGVSLYEYELAVTLKIIGNESEKVPPAS